MFLSAERHSFEFLDSNSTLISNFIWNTFAVNCQAFFSVKFKKSLTPWNDWGPLFHDNRSRLPVIRFTVEKDKKQKQIMRSVFENLEV